MQYLKIKDSLLAQIGSGLLAATEKLPPERTLAESFNTTRITLRAALAVLEAEGKIYREDRRGWFISPTPLKYDPTRTTNFHNLALQQQRQPHSRLISACPIPADQHTAALLNVAPQSELFRIDRVRFLDDRPVLVVTHYVIPARFPDLLSHDLNDSLTDIYRRHYDTIYQRTRYRISTQPLIGDSAKTLRAAPGSPAIYIERTNYNQHGELLDCDLEYWRTDAICIESIAESTPG